MILPISRKAAFFLRAYCAIVIEGFYISLKVSPTEMWYRKKFILRITYKKAVCDFNNYFLLTLVSWVNKCFFKMMWFLFLSVYFSFERKSLSKFTLLQKIVLTLGLFGWAQCPVALFSALYAPCDPFWHFICAWWPFLFLSVCPSVCCVYKSPKRLLNAGTLKVAKCTKNCEKIHRSCDHFRRNRFIITGRMN